MQVITSRAEMRAARGEYDEIGFVPTMGYLHEGHLSLVRRAKSDNGAVAVSIFVNPAQFGPTEDLAAYPRDLDRDLALLAGAGVDLVWTPGVADVYPPGFSTYVDVEGVSAPLEGARRPGHFRGVATVVSILLAVTTPTRAYFGAKDAQQAAVLRRMAADLAFGAEIIVVPTVREPDGLALSSRNVYLAAEERAAALCLSRALRAVEVAWGAGERDAARLRAIGSAIIAAEPRAHPVYFSVADPDTLVEVADGAEVDPVRGALVSTAVQVGAPTLIDNVMLPPVL